MSDTKDTAPPGSKPPSGKRPEPKRRPLYPKAAHRRPHKTTHISTAAVKNEINVTPLVDVVLVLLIIFMVVTPLLQRGKAVQLPGARLVSERKGGSDPIVLSITADGLSWLDAREVPRKELADALSRAVAARPGAAVVVKGDRRLEYRVIREVIREISKARVPGGSLAATPVKAGGE